ncbi:MAG: glycosyltransferase family 4 protein [Chitinophagaceae bacterium]|nr:glycosyltransferase family 4 protein [Chitinophagaceae bacterium]
MQKRIKNILVANHHLEKVGGTESYTYALTGELVKKGYNVEYFTFFKGEVADRLENDFFVPYMSRSKYDLILANHNTCVNYLFGKGFTIQTCHGIFPELEQPSPHADAYVAISEEVKDHLKTLGYDSRIILNGINLKRYCVIHPVQPQLRCVLSLCHSGMANALLEEACDGLGVRLMVQDKYNNPIWKVEEKINQADLVVGVGRSAYEAMACGRPVVVFDHRGYYPSCGDGYVKEIIEKSILNNCSGRYSNRTYDGGQLREELKKYNADDGKFFRAFAEKRLDIQKSVNEYLEYFRQLYRNVHYISVAYFKRIRQSGKWRKSLQELYFNN